MEKDNKKKKTTKKPISMHENIGYWCDCCSCEAEDRWAELADEFDIDLNDYEEPDEQK